MNRSSMSRLLTAAWAVAVIFAASCAARARTPVAADAPTTAAESGWRLVWADEFDRDGRPDPARWTFEQGFVRNKELQWYQPENARCEGGLLVIEARRERKPNPHYDPTSDDWRKNREFARYTSASLITRGLHAWRYGRFEFRARIDGRPGLWPAIWTMGREQHWPLCGEVDIMEYYQGILLANVGWGSATPGKVEWDGARKLIEEFDDPDWANRFHVWRMDWDERAIRLYVDDRLMNETDLAQTLNPDGSNPFHQPHFLLLNLAIGGNSGGDPEGTAFPARFEVDYARVYQRVGK